MTQCHVVHWLTKNDMGLCPEYRSLLSHRCENFKPYTENICFRTSALHRERKSITFHICVWLTRPIAHVPLFAIIAPHCCEAWSVGSMCDVAISWKYRVCLTITLFRYFRCTSKGKSYLRNRPCRSIGLNHPRYGAYRPIWYIEQKDIGHDKEK
jgi:hypothetical protein